MSTANENPSKTSHITVTEAPSTHPTSRLSQLKIAFLYVLIAGVGLAAITSVISLLIGEFTAIIGKTLLTIFILFSHSLLLLAILWADKNNQVGRAVIPTTLFVVIFASLVTTTLGAWGILNSTAAWSWTGLYYLAIGGAFIIAALLKMRLPQHVAHIATNTSIGFIVVTLLSLVPWVLKVVPSFDPLYFRIVAALSILSSAAFLISLVLRGIANSKNPSKAAVKRETIPNGMLAIYIVVGVITAMVWSSGLLSLIISGAQSTL